jgi:16S rRNA G966 N2-methylase RsmD
MKLNTQLKSTYYTHGFHPYPAKFTPQLVSKYFNLYCKNGYSIIDPFCGSGTTLVEAALNGMPSVGIDLNPIACIVSKAKTSQFNEQEISIIKKFLTEIQLLIDKNQFYNINFKNDEIIIPDFPNRNHWFQLNVSYELAYLKKNIERIKNDNVKNLLYCAFSKIIVKVSNQDSEVRYTAKNKKHSDGVVYYSFIETLSNYLNILLSDAYELISNSEIFNGDTYTTLKSFEDNCFDFVITSPPYINTFDYYLYHKQRMFWLGFDHKPVRQKEIGNHHRIDTKKFEDAKFEYVESMTLILNELSRVSKENSYFIMIIGDGIVDGKTIDMSNVICDICERSCYSVENIDSINLSDITKSFNKKFSNAPKKEHYITLKNKK